MRHCPVAALTTNDQIENVKGRHHWPCRDGKLPNRHPGPVVHAIHSFGGKLLEQAFLNHDFRAAFTFFGRLKNEVDGPVEILCLCQILCSTEQHSGVTIMTAAMHLAGRFRGMGKVIAFLHRQRIHVSAQRNRPVAGARLQGSHDARLREATINLDAKALQPFGDKRRCTLFLECQFRMGVKIPTPFGEQFVVALDLVFDGHLILRSLQLKAPGAGRQVYVP